MTRITADTAPTALATATQAASEARARAAAAATAAAQAETVAAEAAAAVEAERRERRIAWALFTVAAFPVRLAEARGHVDTAFSAFERAVREDFAAAPRAYVGIASAMAAGNALGELLAQARHHLRAANIIPPARPNRPDPVGHEHAPFPPADLPSFPDLLASTLDAQRAAAFRARPTPDDPGEFTETVPAQMRHDALAQSYHHDEEWALLAGLQLQAPDRWARLDPARQAATLAWLACREAAGFGDDPLPKVAPAGR
ncbi:MAG TPA: hypothetical protein VLM76_11260 [Patescibacteria group bacterium]|nr:hypothetical protein [Patescibacteria group bacterium]